MVCTSCIQKRNMIFKAVGKSIAKKFAMSDHNMRIDSLLKCKAYDGPAT